MTTHPSIGLFTVEQLIQGLQDFVKKVNYEELESISEKDPDLIDEWASQLGWTLDRFVELVNDGTINAKVARETLLPFYPEKDNLIYHMNIDICDYIERAGIDGPISEDDELN